MIPINEIRVGIWTHNNVERRRLTKEDVAFLMTGDNAHYANPIPLTEEILLKAGFVHKQTDKSDTYTLGDFRAVYVKSGRFKGERFLNYGNVLTFQNFVHCEYLHQLQNLFYCLTGQELKIDL